MTAMTDDTRPLPARDLESAVGALGAADWRELAGARLLLTGGTGFIGRWMLEVLRLAEEHHALGCEVVVLSRNPARFATAAPHLAACSTFRFVAGDVLDPLRLDGAFSHVVHAATDASADLNLNHPRRMFDIVVSGTANLLDFAVAKDVRRVLFLSSGAVYGAQPWDVERVAEDWHGAPDCREPKNAYAEGKRAAEMLCAIARKEHGLDTVTARIFAVLGPLLSLGTHFAAGNFIGEAIAGRPVRVEGAGTAVRSYLYAADLAAWLWAALLRAPAGAIYNMGSEEAVTIAELAARTAGLLGTAGHEILGRPDPGWNPGRYVPSTAWIERELNMRATVALDEAIRRTAQWNGWNDEQG